jgi:hypothetical protein
VRSVVAFFRILFTARTGQAPTMLGDGSPDTRHFDRWIVRMGHAGTASLWLARCVVRWVRLRHNMHGGCQGGH